MLKKTGLSLTVLLLCIFAVYAQTPAMSADTMSGTQSTPAAQKPLTRPKIGLVLSGGGAKGFAQIAVLKTLEELGIPIDVVIGSSSGALVGGLYSAGYSAENIYQILKEIDWPYIFSDQAVHPFDRYFQQIHGSYYFASAGLSRNFDLKIGNSILNGQHVLQVFKDLTVKIPSNTDFNTLPVPYRAVAVDLLSGEPAVLASGDLAEAMRASMSLPGLFSPYEIDGRTYIDGGVTEHLPVHIAREMGCDIVIAIDTGDDLVQNLSTFDANPVVALNQMLNITQSKKNKEEAANADLVIHPNLARYSLMDFYRIDEIIKLGDDAVKANYPAILAIRDKIARAEPSAIRPKNTGESIYLSQLPWLKVQELRIYGALPADINFIESQFKYIKDKELKNTSLSKFTGTIYERGNYRLVMPYIFEENGTGIMELYLVQPVETDHIFRLSMSYESTASNESTSTLIFTPNITLRDLTGRGSVLSLDFSFVNALELNLRYLQPITSRFFLEVSADYGNTYDIFFQTFDFPIYLGYKTQYAGVSLAAGVGFGSRSWLRTEGSFNWMDSSIEIPGVMTVNPTNMVTLATGEFGYSNISSSAFPMSGGEAVLSSLSGFPLNGSSLFFQQFNAHGRFLFPVNSWFRFSLSGILGTEVTQTLGSDSAIGPFYGYTVADREFFPQIINKVSFGSHKAVLAGGFLWRPYNPLTPLGGEIFFTATAAAGNIWDKYTDITEKGLTWAASLGMGVRVNNGLSFHLRAGAGTENNNIKPFLSIDMGTLIY